LGNSTTVEASQDEPAATQPAYITLINPYPYGESAMPTSTLHAPRERHARIHEARAAIGRLLHVEYVPMLTEPLPGELRHLIAQLVAREASREEAGQHPFEALSAIIG
jgi:hypothetical protein